MIADEDVDVAEETNGLRSTWMVRRSLVLRQKYEGQGAKTGFTQIEWLAQMTAQDCRTIDVMIQSYGYSFFPQSNGLRIARVVRLRHVNHATDTVAFLQRT